MAELAANQPHRVGESAGGGGGGLTGGGHASAAPGPVCQL